MGCTATNTGEESLWNESLNTYTHIQPDITGMPSYTLFLEYCNLLDLQSPDYWLVRHVGSRFNKGYYVEQSYEYMEYIM